MGRLADLGFEDALSEFFFRAGDWTADHCSRATSDSSVNG